MIQALDTVGRREVKPATAAKAGQVWVLTGQATA
jgi:hypothetical protein